MVVSACGSTTERVPELLGTLLGVGDVHLDERRTELRAGVEERQRVVRPRTGVEDDRRALVGGGVEPVEQLALVVGLLHLDVEAQLVTPGRAQARQLTVGRRPVDLRLPTPEPPEVGSVEHQDLHGCLPPDPRAYRGQNRHRAPDVIRVVTPLPQVVLADQRSAPAAVEAAGSSDRRARRSAGSIAARLLVHAHRRHAGRRTTPRTTASAARPARGLAWCRSATTRVSDPARARQLGDVHAAQRHGVTVANACSPTRARSRAPSCGRS